MLFEKDSVPHDRLDRPRDAPRPNLPATGRSSDDADRGMNAIQGRTRPAAKDLEVGSIKSNPDFEGVHDDGAIEGPPISQRKKYVLLGLFCLGVFIDGRLHRPREESALIALVLCVCSFYILLTPVSEDLDIVFGEQTWIVVCIPPHLLHMSHAEGPDRIWPDVCLFPTLLGPSSRSLLAQAFLLRRIPRIRALESHRVVHDRQVLLSHPPWPRWDLRGRAHPGVVPTHHGGIRGSRASHGFYSILVVRQPGGGLWCCVWRSSGPHTDVGTRGRMEMVLPDRGGHRVSRSNDTYDGLNNALTCPGSQQPLGRSGSSLKSEATFAQKRANGNASISLEPSCTSLFNTLPLHVFRLTSSASFRLSFSSYSA